MSKPTWADIMASSSNGLPRTTREICVDPEIADTYRVLAGDLEDAIRDEERNKSKEKPTSGRLAGGVSESARITAEMADLIESHPTSFYTLEFQALPRAEWLALRNQHPPRDDNPGDGNMFNTDTFGPAAVRASMVDPEPTDETMAFLDAKLTFGEWELLMLDVWRLNEGIREVPKLPSPSSTQPGSDAA